MTTAPRPDTARPSLVPTTTPQQPSTTQWLLATTLRTVAGEGLLRHFKWTESLSARSLAERLPNPARMFGAFAQEVSEASSPLLESNVTSDIVEAVSQNSAQAVANLTNSTSYRALATEALQKAWSRVPDGPSWLGFPTSETLSNIGATLTPSTTWVTTPISYVFSPFQKAWSFVSETTVSMSTWRPSTPEVVTSGWAGVKGCTQWSWTNLTGMLSENADWIGPTAAVAVSTATINHFLAQKVESPWKRYSLSAIGGVATVWGASELAALALGGQYHVGLEKAADIGLRMGLTAITAQIASPVLSGLLRLTDRYVVEPLGWPANSPVCAKK